MLVRKLPPVNVRAVPLARNFIVWLLGSRTKFGFADVRAAVVTSTRLPRIIVLRALAQHEMSFDSHGRPLPIP